MGPEVEGLKTGAFGFNEDKEITGVGGGVGASGMGFKDIELRKVKQDCS